MLSVGLLAASLAVASCSPAKRPIVAEVYYDAIGDDTGHEFVELFNPGDSPAPLAGLRLEAGDGSGPGRWTLRWTGIASDTLAPHARFVIGGSLVQPAPDRSVTLDLQNGPDAVRLEWPDGAVEVVGYGALAYPEYYCGSPAPDVTAGQSLARVPDDADLGSNALDFRAASPSPGRANQPARDAAIAPGSLALTPEQPEPGELAHLGGGVMNRGGSPIAAGEITLMGSGSGTNGVRALFSLALAATLGPGDSTGFDAECAPLPAGKWTLSARAVLAGDQAPANDTDSLIVRVGAGPLAVTEIQFHPAAGEGEWVEVRNRSSEMGVPTPLDLTAFTIADRGRTRATPGAGAGALEPESLAVLAQDRAALLAHYPALDPSRVWSATPWAALNNSDDSTGVADIVTLRESDGTLCERVLYSAAGVPPGVPIELRGGSWLPDQDPGGTPLAPPLELPAPTARLVVVPRRLHGDSVALFSWALPWPRGRVAIELYDLAGRRAALALTESLVPGRGAREWRASALPPGLYVAVLRARAEQSGEMLTHSVPLRIEGSAP